MTIEIEIVIRAEFGYGSSMGRPDREDAYLPSASSANDPLRDPPLSPGPGTPPDPPLSPGPWVQSALACRTDPGLSRVYFHTRRNPGQQQPLDMGAYRSGQYRYTTPRQFVCRGRHLSETIVEKGNALSNVNYLQAYTLQFKWTLKPLVHGHSSSKFFFISNYK